MNVADGDHEPGTAVNTFPTTTAPVIVGTGAVVNGDDIADVATLEPVSEVYPAFTAVTSTFTNLPLSVGFYVYVLPVAPEIAVYVPDAVDADFHTYLNESADGDHVPSAAVKI